MTQENKTNKRAVRSRALAALLALALLFALSACGGRTEEETAPEPAAAAPAAEPETIAPEEPAVSEQEEPEQEEETEEKSEEEPEEEPEPSTPPEEGEWMLLLVNADHPLPEDFTVTLTGLRNDHWVDERIYPELQQMFDDARAVGIYPYVNESYRTLEQQQEIMDAYVARYEESGMSYEEAVAAARQYVAPPGTSEHHTGLALDIVAEYSDEESYATWEWLAEHCMDYGFILRYPADKEDVTGYAYEPWHFRYVGVKAARIIMENGLCLEEYLDGSF